MSKEKDVKHPSKQKDWKKVIEKADKAESATKQDKKVGEIEHPDYKKLEAKLTEAEQRVEKYKDESMRRYAEMENMRKRMERDIANAHKFGLEKLIKELLPVIDSLEHGIANCESDNDLTKKIHEGLVLTLDMFLKNIAKFAVEQIDPIGEKFDPERHEAMSMADDPQAKSGTIIRVFQKGYLLNGRLLRPALVIVAN